MISKEYAEKGFVSLTNIQSSLMREDGKLFIDNSLSVNDEIVLPDSADDLPVKVEDLVINGVPVMRDGQNVKFTSILVTVKRRNKVLYKTIGSTLLSKRIHDAKSDTSISMQGEPVKDFTESGCEYVLDAWADMIAHGIKSIKVTNVTQIDAATWDNGAWDCTKTRKAKLYTFAYGEIYSKNDEYTEAEEVTE